MELAPDFDEFIGSLTAHGVEFIVVGAYALAFHGAPRFTGDLDILVRPTTDNAARVLAALRGFGFPVSELSPEAIADRRRMLQMGVPPVQIHVMSAISGVDWEEAWADRPSQGPRRHRRDRTRARCVTPLYTSFRSCPSGGLIGGSSSTSHSCRHD
jgi:hypothetical protein